LHRFSPVEYFRHKVPLLWSTVLVVVLGIVSLSSLFYIKFVDWEEDRLTRNAQLANDAFAHHSLQVMAQVDTLLKAVRSYYLRTGSLDETDHFIDTLSFDKSIIDNLYLIGPDAKVLIARTPEAKGRQLGVRDYMSFHRSTSNDEIFIGQVEKGAVTEKFHFRVTRPIRHPDGSFGGVVLATVTPESFATYYQHLMAGTHNTAALLGTVDHKLRARTHAPAVEQWVNPVESPLWEALRREAAGSYHHVSPVDGVDRVFSYRKVGDLPLVVVTGFSKSVLITSVHESGRWLAVGVLTALGPLLVLTLLLTVEIHHRNEQNRFLSMLSHELKTPLSVCRMALGSEGEMSETTRAFALQSVQDMDSLVERCLQVDRLQNRGLVLNLQNCHLGETLADVQAASPTPHRLSLQLSILPVIRTDAQMVRVVLNNLIDNALKYAAANSVVQISACRHDHRRKQGILVVVDNTPGSTGMPDVRQIFKKYYRNPGTQSRTGSGLGLFLVGKLIKQLGGWVRYVPVTGIVRFEFWLPGS
jgi:signal transduction histidine kinase